MMHVEFVNAKLLRISERTQLGGKPMKQQFKFDNF